MTDSVRAGTNYGESLQAAAERYGLPGDLVQALEEVEAANRVMRTGDPKPYIEQWKSGPDVTLYGAWGPIEQGIDRLRSTFTWVGTRFTGGDVITTYTTVRVGGDLAVTTGFESGETSVDHGESVLMRIRVTHVLERAAAGNWALVHRHADFPPADQRRTEGS